MKYKNLILVTVLLMTVGLTACQKRLGDIPQGDATKIAKYGEVDFAELKQKIADKSATIIDVNSKETYKLGHIPTAISYYEHESDLSAILPENKDAEIICYCGGPSCTAWLKGADAVSALGYKNIKHFIGGLSGWTSAGGELQ